MTIFLYARVSTLDQNTDSQKADLLKAYPDAVYREEKLTGTTTRNRDKLELILEMISKGDKLVVWKLDRLARNMNDLTNIIEVLNSKGAFLEILDHKIDTEKPAGKAFVQMLGVFAEFENNLRKERQMAGIKAAKAKGKHLGRKASLSDEQKRDVIAGHEAGKNPSQLSREFDVSRATIYNVLKGK